MYNTVASITTFLDRRTWPDLRAPNVVDVVGELAGSEDFKALLLAFVEAHAFSDGFGREFSDARAVAAIAPCRMLRGSLNLSLRRFFALLAQVFAALENGRRHPNAASDWGQFADRVDQSIPFCDLKLVDYLTKVMPASPQREYYVTLAARLENDLPQAIYPTSDYRESGGSVLSTADDQTIEAVMRVSTFSTIKIVDRAIDIEQSTLRDIFKSIGRCVCLVDENVESVYGEQIEFYFAYHNIPLRKRVYRANEADKSIGTVERMLGGFKALGVSRNEPVLIIGGGVLADTGGLACALYGRNTPYVMLATSIVTGIDAGPSPRTCCDGFGYKNLFGAYHPPVVSITDRFFFKTLRDGWLRHGIA